MRTLFTTKEAYEQLRVSMPTIQSWIHQGRLPVLRLGRRGIYSRISSGENCQRGVGLGYYKSLMQDIFVDPDEDIS